MVGRDKLFSSIVANPKSVRFGDACKPARLIGFVHGGDKGSHFVFKCKDEPVQLNFQNRGGLVPTELDSSIA